MNKIYNWILEKVENYKRKRRFKKKLKELQKKDPFVYKH